MDTRYKDQHFSNYPENFDRTMQIIEPTYDQHILKPPEKNITNGRIPNRLFIDSSDRNCNKYLFENNYVYQLNKEYKNVVSVELVQGSIPYTGYIINKNNNKLFLQETFGDTITIQIPVGDYNAVNLATAIQTALNNPNNGTLNTYIVTEDSNTRKFTIQSDLVTGDNIFRLLNNCCQCPNNAILCNDCDTCPICRQKNCKEYIKGTISKKIGFDKVNFIFARGIVTNIESIDDVTAVISACQSQFLTDFTNTNGSSEFVSFVNLADTRFTVLSVDNDMEMTIIGTVEDMDSALTSLIGSKIYANKHISNFTWDLEDVEYVILDIEHLENIDSNNKNMDNSFGVIFFLVPHGSNNVIVNGSLPRRGIETYFNPPLAKLDRLRIKFLTKDGNLYDFNGRDHALEFDIISLNQPGKYNTLITT